VAARLRTDLREDVTLEEGGASEFTVLVNGAVVMKRGLWALLGMVPPYGKILAAVREALASGAGA
jgi:hypothetical protein